MVRPKEPVKSYSTEDLIKATKSIAPEIWNK
jgi:hypothetical protein